jgi:hypothetical protein
MAPAESNQPADSETASNAQDMSTFPIPPAISAWVDHSTWGNLTAYDRNTTPTPEETCSFFGFLIECWIYDGLTGHTLWWQFK